MDKLSKKHSDDLLSNISWDCYREREEIHLYAGFISPTSSYIVGNMRLPKRAMCQLHVEADGNIEMTEWMSTNTPQHEDAATDLL